MRIAETVTFGGATLDRAAELRTDEGALAALLSTGRILPVWRGKPLIAGDDLLGWVAAGSPVLAAATAAPVFLGRDGATGFFAQDISGWQPEGSAAEVGTFFDPTRQTHPALPADWSFAELRGVMTLLDRNEAELAATARAILGWHATHGFCATCGASLFWQAEPGNRIYVTAGSLDAAAGLAVAEHIWVASRPDWDEIGGTAPQRSGE